MKKIIISIGMILGLLGSSVASAGTLSGGLKKLPPLNQGVAYSLADSNFNYLSTLDVVRWKALTLEAGYAGRAENTDDKLVAVLSVKLLELKDYVQLPVLDLIEFRPGIWYGWGNLGNWNNAEGDWGVSATVVSLKF